MKKRAGAIFPAPLFGLSRRQLSLLLIFAFVAGLVRFYLLGEKPVHHDETINGWFVMQMWQNGFYKYDPSNYHGPLLFYLFQYLEPVLGNGIASLRGVTSFFSLLPAIYFFALGLKNKQMSWLLVALALLFSPAQEFFSRSAIHEAPFSFFILVFLLGLWRSWRVCLLGLVGMIALKETWVLFFFSLIFAAGMQGRWLWPQLHGLKEKWKNDIAFRERLGKDFFLAGLAVVLLYSGFGQYWEGVLDLFKAFLPWTKTGVGGAGHEKPFYFWLELIFKNETATFLFFLLSLGGLFLKTEKVRFFSMISLGQFLLYSLIPYKTPWCLLSLQLPLFYSGGMVLEQIFHHRKWLWSSFFALAISLNAGTFYALNWQHPIAMDHPYVYVQTQYEAKNLVSSLVAHQQEIFREKIQIATTEVWPFPWLLRQFPQISYGNAESAPDPQALVVLFDHNQIERLRPLMAATHVEKSIQVRQAREPAVLFVRKDWAEQIGGEDR